MQNISMIKMQQNGYVTQLTENADGTYDVTFNDGNTVTLKNGRDGKDGVDGQDGKDSELQVSARKDQDGLWYWIVNGEWILDLDGNKMRAGAVDGKDGKDGTDGKDGVDGKDGKDGTDGKDGRNGLDGKDTALYPIVRINERTGMWEISNDNGNLWINTGVAANGKDGKDGSPGADGKEDIFASVIPSTSGTSLIILTKATETQPEQTFSLPILQQ